MIENRILPPRENYLGEISRNESTFITIHESSDGLGYAEDNRTLEYYEDKLLHPPKGLERIGYHFMVSDSRIVQFIPITIRTAHAGSTEGNSSIGIERLTNRFIDFPKAIENQAKLVATLMTMYNIPIEHVVPHKHWSGKECPSRLLAGLYGGWDGFITQVKAFYDSGEIFDASEIK